MDVHGQRLGRGARPRLLGRHARHGAVGGQRAHRGRRAAKAGAEIKNFVRFEVGEGIEVEKVDFAEEVAAQLKG